MYLYRFSPQVYIEYFDSDAVILVADRDKMITVNQAAADIFSDAHEDVGSGPFTREDVVVFLREHYALSEEAAWDQMRSLLGFGLRHRIILKVLNSLETSCC